MSTKRHHFKPNYSGRSCEYVVGKVGRLARAVRGSRVVKEYCCKPSSDPVHFSKHEKGTQR